MKRIYLACPFSHWCFLVRWWRFIVASRCAARIMSDGYIVFSPVSHSFPIAFFHNRRFVMTDHKFWMKQDLPMMDFCQVLVVISFGGAYRRSSGVGAESGRAYEKFKSVFVFDAKKILKGDYIWDIQNS